MDRRLSRFLRQRGAAPEEVERAEAEGWLTLLTLDRIFFHTPSRYTVEEVSARSGTDTAVAVRMWRALGFPDVPEGTRGFSDEDVEALEELKSRLGRVTFARREGDAVEDLVRQVRVVGGGLARVAEALSDQVVDAVWAARRAGFDDEQVACMLVEDLGWEEIARLNDYALRLQMRAAVWRKLAADVDEEVAPEIAVGFLDLVGYTALSQELDESQLTELVDRFEALAHETIAECGGRVVKTIGDEVMFVADTADVAATIALRLTARTEGDELLPDARAGVAWGSVLAREGDYYGPVVNLAHRLVEIARPGSVIVPDALRDAIAGNSAFTFVRLRPRRIRDIGRIEPWVLRPGPEAPDTVGAA